MTQFFHYLAGSEKPDSKVVRHLNFGLIIQISTTDGTHVSLSNQPFIESVDNTFRLSVLNTKSKKYQFLNKNAKKSPSFGYVKNMVKRDTYVCFRDSDKQSAHNSRTCESMTPKTTSLKLI